ncbi:hypothetical protein GW932_02800 [archaeon]|nr:hypothetical protein [archaeon]
MSTSLSKAQAQVLLDSGYITLEKFNEMFSSGLVKSSTRSTRPQINVPEASKEEFYNKSYDAMLSIAKEMGFDYETVSPYSGLATLYLKGAGKAKAEVTESVKNESELTF